MGRGSQASAAILYGKSPRTKTQKPVLFVTMFNAQRGEWRDLDEWFREQRNFDSDRECWEILSELARDGVATWAEVNYLVLDEEAFRTAFAEFPEPEEEF